MTAKSFQDRIKVLEDYHPDVLYKNGAFVLKIKFNDRWQIIKPKDNDVAYSQDNRIKNLHWYVSTIENTDKLFDLIDETIVINKEFEKKCVLYKKKVKELQELFLSDVPYERLAMIQFNFADNSNKPKKKKTANKAKKDEKKCDVKLAHGNTAIENVGSQDIVEVKTDSVADETYSGSIDDAIEKVLGEK